MSTRTNKQKNPFFSTPEVIVIAKKIAGIRINGTVIKSLSKVKTTSINQLLKREQLFLKPLFGKTEDEVNASTELIASDRISSFRDLSTYYKLEYPVGADLKEICTLLNKEEVVETAYIKPAAEPASTIEAFEEILEFDPNNASLNDLVSRQNYLEAAPVGIDANYAWRQKGGKGEGVSIIDIEGGWNFNHEDLRKNQGGIIAGTNSEKAAWRNHGTAVLGQIGGDENTNGIVGIAPKANIRSCSILGNDMSTSTAIFKAANALEEGDIILIEVHRPGPRFGYESRTDQKGYIPIEWWPDDFDAITYATAKGIIVVEVGGNGAEDLDHPIYDIGNKLFPTNWSNPFKRTANSDCGAILVGAGAPPTGTHGRNHGPGRSRLAFSNYGSCIDAQGWGEEVTTCAYGDLVGGSNQNTWYTDTFSGTSSASPIVVGAIACIQGILSANGKVKLTPARTRAILRRTGSLQQDAPQRSIKQRIGNLPDLRQIIKEAMGQKSWTGVQFAGKVDAGETAKWFTHSWPAHWHVVWTILPAPNQKGTPELDYKIHVERESHKYVRYNIEVTNLATKDITIEARYAVVGW